MKVKVVSNRTQPKQVWRHRIGSRLPQRWGDSDVRIHPISYYNHKVKTLGKMNVVISDKLENEFREAVFKKYGMKKGNIAKAINDALSDWVKKSANRT